MKVGMEGKTSYIFSLLFLCALLSFTIILGEFGTSAPLPLIFQLMKVKT